MTAGERPLSAGARGALVAGAMATILAFYVILVGAIVVDVVVVLVLFVALFGGARFGLGLMIGRLLKSPLALLRVFARNLWLSSGRSPGIILVPAEAPRLFERVRTLSAKMGVDPPT